MRQVTQYLFTLKGTVSFCVLQILFFSWTGVINRDCINLRQSLHCKDVVWKGIQLVRYLLSAFKQFEHLSHLPFTLHPKIHEHKRPAISLIIKALLWNCCGREWNKYRYRHCMKKARLRAALLIGSWWGNDELSYTMEQSLYDHWSKCKVRCTFTCTLSQVDLLQMKEKSWKLSIFGQKRQGMGVHHKALGRLMLPLFGAHLSLRAVSIYVVGR